MTGYRNPHAHHSHWVRENGGASTAELLSAIRSNDLDHLVLGVRFTGKSIWEIADEYARVPAMISINHCSPTGKIDKLLLDKLYVMTGKPILISEYSFRATRNRSGNPNTRAPEVTVATQEEHAGHAARYVRQVLRLPCIAGLHGFSWEDQRNRDALMAGF